MPKIPATLPLRMNCTMRMASSMAAYCFLLPATLYSRISISSPYEHSFSSILSHVCSIVNVHLLLSAPPNVASSQMAHQLKGATARRVFQSFPACRKIFPHGSFWSPSYYVGSVGIGVWRRSCGRLNCRRGSHRTLGPRAQAPNKERPFIPGLKDQGFLGRPL